MKKIFCTLTVACCLCGYATAATQKNSNKSPENKRDTVVVVPVSPYSMIDWYCVGWVTMVEGDQYSIRMKGTVRNVKKVEMKTVADTLFMKINALPEENELGVHFELTMPKKELLRIRAKSFLHVSGTVPHGELKIQSLNFGSLYLEQVKANSMALEKKGSGELEIEDLTCGNLALSVSNEAALTMEKVSVQSGAISCTSSENAELKAITIKNFALSKKGEGNLNITNLQTDSFAFKGEGSGNVTLQGKATSSSIKWTGSGIFNKVALETENSVSKKDSPRAK